MGRCSLGETCDVMMDKSKYFHEFVKFRVGNVIPSLIIMKVFKRITWTFKFGHHVNILFHLGCVSPYLSRRMSSNIRELTFNIRGARLKLWAILLYPPPSGGTEFFVDPLSPKIVAFCAIIMVQTRILLWSLSKIGRSGLDTVVVAVFVYREIFLWRRPQRRHFFHRSPCRQL